jgi:hypothetical protein
VLASTRLGGRFDLQPRADRSLLSLLIGDGLPLLALTGALLVISGMFAVFLAMRREFLPHDVAFLGMSAESLCRVAGCRVVAFMFHDRVAFGGTLIAIGTLYLYLAAGPLAEGERWAWRALLVSGTLGFLSFLAYRGYGYLDTWHGAATLALLPCFTVGLVRSRRLAVRLPQSIRLDAHSADPLFLTRRWCLVATAAGLVAAGCTILVVGMTRVFVPQDLSFMGLTPERLQQISPRLIPLIAHDRAGFGGGLMSTGCLIGFCAWYAPTSRAFRQAVTVAGLAGFGCGLGVHFAEGYVDFSHLLPAFAGASLFLVALLLEVIGARRVGSPAAALA